MVAKGGITRSRVENWQRLDFFFFPFFPLDTIRWCTLFRRHKKPRRNMPIFVPTLSPVEGQSTESSALAKGSEKRIPGIVNPLFSALPRRCTKSAARTKLRPQGILPRRDNSGWLAVVVSPQPSLLDHAALHTYADDITSASWQAG